jgi:hypothetical protein
LEQALLQPAVAAGAEIIRLQPFENLEVEAVFAMGIPGVLQAGMPVMAQSQGEPEPVADRGEIECAADSALARGQAG